MSLKSLFVRTASKKTKFAIIGKQYILHATLSAVELLLYAPKATRGSKIYVLQLVFLLAPFLFESLNRLQPSADFQTPVQSGTRKSVV